MASKFEIEFKFIFLHANLKCKLTLMPIDIQALTYHHFNFTSVP